MDGIVIGIIVAAVEVAVTTTVGLIINSVWSKKQKDREELERLREVERQQKADARDAKLEKNFNDKIDRLEKKIDDDTTEIDNNIELMKKTMQKDVRRSLRQDGDMYVRRGWASHQEKTEYDELYWAYHNLGRNGVMDSLHDKVMDLPTEPQENN